MSVLCRVIQGEQGIQADGIYDKEYEKYIRNNYDK